MTPNVLLLMSDQHAPHAASSYGSTEVHTPHIDALAARRTTFDAAHCNSPIRVPSRAAMATGRYVHRTGDYDNASPHTGSEAASWDTGSKPPNRRDLDQLQQCRKELLAICNPVEVDSRIRAQQRRRVEEHGGIDAVPATPLTTHSPAGRS
ncbi:hypothetical protein GCM10009676_39510 [Prauserella halophila]|uniref:Sulfatase N-terminal domain-containing protein n=1 Tax=Prauserella halophila TaxID=185641 RepID=A0ABN1WFW7_9PSEU|nr:sulfatase-like hydrolase/transferase [Prauserella halophila]MCP2238216.1 Sulfatase [Prauserella halophila]